MKNVLVIGTGTIGEPLIGLLADFKKELDISVFFHKRTPLNHEIAKVNSLIDRGAKLVVDEGMEEAFTRLGHEPVLFHDTALRIADVVIDCTPAGNINKEMYYQPLLEEKYCATKNKNRLFIAQGSEKGFGLPYAYGINDEALKESKKKKNNFVQVVSCNTHNICSVLKSLSPKLSSQELLNSDFVCIRRSNDISQESSFIPSPEVGKHSDATFGTHHAHDASRVITTLHKTLNLFSSAMKVNSQYMHTIRFNILLHGHITTEQVLSRFRENPFVTLTHKKTANKVFSFGRDHGYYGRIFNQTVVSIPSVATPQLAGKTQVTGFCFTPQDGNSLLSSIAATLHHLYGAKYTKYMKHFDRYLFDMV